MVFRVGLTEKERLLGVREHFRDKVRDFQGLEFGHVKSGCQLNIHAET